MEKLFPAYTGNEPYAFVCYSHEDREIIYPEIDWLRQQGINLWYDEGISAGKNWRAAIGDSLLGASHVLFYISTRSLKSEHCNREINLALDKNMEVVPIYLEEVELTSDLMVGLSRVQALHRSEDGRYKQHLLSALGQSTLVTKPQPTPVRRRGSRIAAYISVILVLALAIGYNYRETLHLTLLMNAPSLFITPIEQEIGFVTAPDGVRIAYATTGQGPPIIQTSGFGTHIENGFQSPLYDSAGTIAMTSRDHLYVRYDGRGFGLSDRDVDDFSLQARVSDLESVVDALGLESFDLLAASAGGPVGIEYTARHPERVTRLVLAGTYASSNWLDNVKRESWERMWDLFDVDWQNPVVSEMLASLLLSPAGGDLDRRIIGQLLRRSAEGETAVRFFRTIYSEDTTEQAKRINVPTLILQGTDDAITDVGAGRELASLIPGSQIEFVEGGHIAAAGNYPAIRRRILDFFEDK